MTLESEATVHTFSRFEREVRWDLGDRSGSSRTLALRSGLELSLSRLRWKRSWALAFDPEPSTLKFLITCGPGPTLTTPGGAAHELASGTAHVGGALPGPTDPAHDPSAGLSSDDTDPPRNSAAPRQ